MDVESLIIIVVLLVIVCLIILLLMKMILVFSNNKTEEVKLFEQHIDYFINKMEEFLGTLTKSTPSNVPK